MRVILNKFSLFDLLLIALIGSLGIAVKPVISPLVRIITGPLMIPGGAVAGGLYMMFIVLAYGLTRRRFAGTLTSTVQAFIVVLTGIGSHGVISFATYIVPGIAVDLVMLAFYFKNSAARPKAPACFCAGIAANVTGSLIVGAALFDIPLIPLLLMLASAALSGGLGGILAYLILKRIYKLELLFNDESDEN